MSPEATDWMLRIAAIALGAGAAILLAWSLFWDRSRGRRRCPKCWYNLEGAVQSETPTCPECGRECSARSLLRTRRRWRWAGVAALLGVVAYGAGLAPTVRKTGWRSAVPTSVLLIVCSPSDWIEFRRDAHLARELANRINDDKAARWQSYVWAARVRSALRAQGTLNVASHDEPVLARLAAARLTRTFTNQAVADVFAELARDLGVNIHLDAASFESMGAMRSGQRISLTLVNERGDVALRSVLGACGHDALTVGEVLVLDGGVTISTHAQAPTPPRTGMYDLATLIGRLEAERRALGGVEHGDSGYTSWLGIAADLIGTPRYGSADADRSTIGRTLVVSGSSQDLLRFEASLGAMERSFGVAGPLQFDARVNEDEWSDSLTALTKLDATTLRPENDVATLADVLDAIALIAGIGMDADWGQLIERGVHPDHPMRLSPDGMLATEILDSLTDLRPELWWTISRGTVRLRASAHAIEPHLHTRILYVGDLVDDARRTRSSDPAFADLCFANVHAAISRAIGRSGAVWNVDGGFVGQHFIGRRLAVSATMQEHREVDSLLARFRTASAELVAAHDRAQRPSGNPATSP